MERKECRDCILRDTCNNKYDYGIMQLGRAGFDVETNTGASATQELYNQSGENKIEVHFDIEMGPRVEEIDISRVGDRAGKAINKAMSRLSKSLSR